MFKRFFLLVTILFFTAVTFAQTDSPFVRFPAVNYDGSKIAFSYQGDIWKSDINGNNPIRLTINKGYDYYPMWNNTGSKIAFSSNRFGSYDVFTMDENGGNVKRITYHSAQDYLNDWSRNGELLFTTARNFRQIEWQHEIYKASPNGGTPVRTLNSVGEMPVQSPDGRYIAFVRGACRIEREAYEGPANKDVWLYDTKEDTFRKLTTAKGNDFYPRWKNNGEIYFIGSRNGVYNIYEISIKGDKIPTEKQITNFKDGGIRYLNISGNGKILVFERFTDIYSLNTETLKANKINVKISPDFRFAPYESKSQSSSAEEFAVSPDGKMTAFVIHGEIFVTENSPKKKRTVNVTQNPARDENPQWLNDTTLVFVSDRAGERDLYLLKSAEKNQPVLLFALQFETKKLTDTKEEESAPKISPDGKKIAYIVGRGKLVVADIDKNGEMENSRTLLNGWATPQDVVWSPDSRWLAYAIDDLYFNTDVFIQSADGKVKPVNVSMHPKVDSQPMWSPDGSKLMFVSERSKDNDIWFAWLRKADWEKTKSDWEFSEDLASFNPHKKKGKKKNKSEVKPIKIDLDGIYNRLVHLTNMPGDEFNPVASNDGKTIYFSSQTPTAKGRDLFSIKWDGTKTKQITKGGKSPSQMINSVKSKSIFMKVKGGRLAKLKEGSSKLSTIAFKAKYKIDFAKEKKQVFDEAWRALNEGFYDPNFHGKNWDALRKKYEPLAMKASTKHDFRDMVNVMLGQLNASHMGLYGEDRPKIEKETTGLIGLEVVPDGNGVKITHVVYDSPADKDFSRLYVGDIIEEVNGEKIDDKTNFYSLLNGTVGERTLLKVKNDDGERDVVIRPTNSLRDQLYNEWVKKERELTDKYSNGRLGYLHIKAMGWDSFEKFERDLTAAGYGKEGLVIDVRYNGGGWTTDYLMTVLNYKQHAYTIPRGAAKNLKKDHLKFRQYYPLGERLPYSAWTKKSVALCNENSYSNAEIFSHAYKTLGIGTLVGQPTFGAVISTGGVGLMDGSYVRLPFRAWYVYKTNENMEWGPAVPDIIVENSPDGKVKGRDEQLKAAVNVLLKQIDESTRERSKNR